MHGASESPGRNAWLDPASHPPRVIVVDAAKFGRKVVLFTFDNAEVKENKVAVVPRVAARTRARVGKDGATGYR